MRYQCIHNVIINTTKSITKQKKMNKKEGPTTQRERHRNEQSTYKEISWHSLFSFYFPPFRIHIIWIRHIRLFSFPFFITRLVRGLYVRKFASLYISSFSLSVITTMIRDQGDTFLLSFLCVVLRKVPRLILDEIEKDERAERIISEKWCAQLNVIRHIWQKLQ